MAGQGGHPDGTPRKRKWGTGSIRWHHGAWEITIRPSRGAPQEPWTRLPGKTVEEAEALLDLKVAQAKAGAYVAVEPRPTEMTVVQLWALYKESLEERLQNDNIEQARVDDIISIMERHVLPAFGTDPCSAVDSFRLNAYMRGKLGNDEDPRHIPPVTGAAKRKLAPRTIRHQIQVIGQMFRWGAHDERRYTAYDPTSGGLYLPKLDHVEAEPYELDDVETICRLTPAGTERRITQALFAAGWRIAEGLGQQEDGWRPARGPRLGQLAIRHALKRSGGKMELAERGKNPNAARTLSLSEQFGELIDEQVAHNATLPQVSNHLFRTEAGTAWNPSNYRNRVWYPAVYAARVKLMPEAQREQWLAHVPPDLRHAAQLLCIDDVTVRAVLDARRSDLDGNLFSYRDADGQRRTAELADDLAAGLLAGPADDQLGRVFPGRRGQPIGLDAFIKTVFREPFERTRQRFDRRIHRARHTFISVVSLDSDISEKEMDHRAGHANAASRAPYTHLMAAQRAKAADILPQLAARPEGGDQAANAGLIRAAGLLGLPVERLRAALDTLD